MYMLNKISPYTAIIKVQVKYMLKKILPVLMLLTLIGCQKENREWNPLFEDTGFDYLHTEIDRSLSIIDEAYSEAGKDNSESVRKKLYQVRKRLLEIKDYYIPFTTVRQKIYDAERFFKLKNIKKSEKLLSDSKFTLRKIDLVTENEVFDKVILELESMIDEVILSLDDNSELNTYNKMKTLGEHINLMLSRGDLVLSGIEFNK